MSTSTAIQHHCFILSMEHAPRYTHVRIWSLRPLLLVTVGKLLAVLAMLAIARWSLDRTSDAAPLTLQEIDQYRGRQR